MKIFIDTNIFLDVLLQRQNAQSGIILLNAVKEGLYDGYVLDITLLNIDYVAKKQAKDIRSFLTLVNQNFAVVGADNSMIEEALELNNSDFEDSLQYVCAKKAKCLAIITNDEGFYKGEIELFSSDKFVQNLK